MSVVAKATYFFRTALHGMWHAPFVHVIAVATIAIAVFSFGLAYGAARWVEALLSSIGGEVQMTVYLAQDTPPEQAEELARALASRAGGGARVVPKEEALRRLSSELGGLGGALEALPVNPLPQSIEVELPAGRRQVGEVRELAEKVRALPMVAAVDYGEEALARLEAVARLLRFGGLAGFAVVVLTTVVIVSATLQLAIYARREEVEIQKLVGATDRFVRVPFLIEGLLQGLLGSALALLGLWLLSWAVGSELAEAFAFLAPAERVLLIDPRRAGELLAVGCGLGLLGSLVAVRRFLRS
ncbi:MAG: ABC transporter permease [Myxococcales bacterium]|nr:ABC transporter permease [Myxococcales bacterium]